MVTYPARIHVFFCMTLVMLVAAGCEHLNLDSLYVSYLDGSYVAPGEKTRILLVVKGIRSSVYYVDIDSPELGIKKLRIATDSSGGRWGSIIVTRNKDGESEGGPDRCTFWLNVPDDVVFRGDALLQCSVKYKRAISSGHGRFKNEYGKAKFALALTIVDRGTAMWRRALDIFLTLLITLGWSAIIAAILAYLSRNEEHHRNDWVQMMGVFLGAIPAFFWFCDPAAQQLGWTGWWYAGLMVIWMGLYVGIAYLACLFREWYESSYAKQT